MRNIHKIPHRNGSYLASPAIRRLADARARPLLQLILLAIAAVAIVGWVALSDGLVDRNGADRHRFLQLLRGRLIGARRQGRLRLRHGRALHPRAAPVRRRYGWLYPPNFFLVAAPLALLAYPDALWQGVTLALYLAMIAAILTPARREHAAIAK